MRKHPKGYWTQRGVMPRWTLIGAYVLITLVFVVTAKWSHDASVKASQAAVEIQSQRVAAVRMSCQDQNRRHDETIATLDKLIAQVPGSRRQRAKESRNSTVLLINALAPKRDCEAVVRAAVKTPPPAKNLPK